MRKTKEAVDNILMKLSFQDEIRENQILRDDLGFDSLGMVELMVALEEAFSIEFDAGDLDPERWNSVSDLYALIEKYVEV